MSEKPDKCERVARVIVSIGQFGGLHNPPIGPGPGGEDSLSY